MNLDRIQIVGSAPEAVIRDTGVSVEQIVTLMADGSSSDQVREVYPLLDQEDVTQAVLYSAREAVTVCEREAIHINA